MSSMMRAFNLVVFSLALSSLSLAGAAQVQAQGLSQIWSQVQQVFNLFDDGLQISDVDAVLQVFFDPPINPTLEGIDEQLQQVLLDQIGQQIENKPGGTYAIDLDKLKTAKIELGNQIAIDSALSKNALARFEQTSSLVKNNVSNTLSLAQEAEGLNVTQDLLKKMAQQESLAAVREGWLLQQNLEAKRERAVNNLLVAQQLSELVESNTARRRERSSVALDFSFSVGLLSLPGLAPESLDNPHSNLTPFNPDDLIDF